MSVGQHEVNKAGGETAFSMASATPAGPAVRAPPAVNIRARAGAVEQANLGKSKLVPYEELSKYFALPIDAAAKELNVCVTVLKKQCRAYGVQRWPHRKLAALDKLAQKLHREERHTAELDNHRAGGGTANAERAGNGETAVKSTHKRSLSAGVDARTPAKKPNVNATVVSSKGSSLKPQYDDAKAIETATNKSEDGERGVPQPHAQQPVGALQQPPPNYTPSTQLVSHAVGYHAHAPSGEMNAHYRHDAVSCAECMLREQQQYAMAPPPPMHYYGDASAQYGPSMPSVYAYSPYVIPPAMGQEYYAMHNRGEYGMHTGGMYGIMPMMGMGYPVSQHERLASTTNAPPPLPYSHMPYSAMVGPAQEVTGSDHQTQCKLCGPDHEHHESEREHSGGVGESNVEKRGYHAALPQSSRVTGEQRSIGAQEETSSRVENRGTSGISQSDGEQKRRMQDRMSMSHLTSSNANNSDDHSFPLDDKNGTSVEREDSTSNGNETPPSAPPLPPPPPLQPMLAPPHWTSAAGEEPSKDPAPPEAAVNGALPATPSAAAPHPTDKLQTLLEATSSLQMLSDQTMYAAESRLRKGGAAEDRAQTNKTSGCADKERLHHRTALDEALVDALPPSSRGRGAQQQWGMLLALRVRIWAADLDFKVTYSTGAELAVADGGSLAVGTDLLRNSGSEEDAQKLRENTVDGEGSKLRQALLRAREGQSATLRYQHNDKQMMQIIAPHCSSRGVVTGVCGAIVEVNDAEQKKEPPR